MGEGEAGGVLVTMWDSTFTLERGEWAKGGRGRSMASSSFLVGISGGEEGVRNWAGAGTSGEAGVSEILREGREGEGRDSEKSSRNEKKESEISKETSGRSSTGGESELVGEIGWTGDGDLGD